MPGWKFPKFSVVHLRQNCGVCPNKPVPSMAKLHQTQTPGLCSHVEESPLGDSSRNGISLHRRVDISGLISWPTINYFFFFFLNWGRWWRKEAMELKPPGCASIQNASGLHAEPCLPGWHPMSANFFEILQNCSMSGLCKRCCGSRRIPPHLSLTCPSHQQQEALGHR